MQYDRDSLKKNNNNLYLQTKTQFISPTFYSHDQLGSIKFILIVLPINKLNTLEECMEKNMFDYVNGEVINRDWDRIAIQVNPFMPCDSFPQFNRAVNSQLFYQMSVYSGFATRQQQKRYNQLIETVISALSKRLIKFYAGQICQQFKFKSLMVNIHEKMFALQQSKYMTPHYSHLVKQFINDMQSIFQHFSRLKDQDPFSQSFLDLKKPHQKIQINTFQKKFQEFSDSEPDLEHREESKKTIHGTISNNFRKKMKTATPQMHFRPNFHTPQKPSSMQKQKASPLQKSVESKNNFKQKINIFKNDDKKPKVREVILVPRIQKINQQKCSLSPTQFLRQTIMGRQQKDKDSHMALRTKQKHQKMVKL